MGRADSSPIIERQNDPHMLRLLRAMTVSHLRAQRLASSHLAVSALLALAALVSVFEPSATTPVVLVGFLWALVYASCAESWTAKEFTRAALFQELFDVRLFRLPWNEVAAGPMPTVEEASRTARRYRGSEERVRDYYEIPDLPRPLDVLACQLQNLSWGSRIRRRYGSAVLTGLILWCLAGAVLGLVAELTVPELLLRWYVPSLGLLLLGLDIHRSQRQIAAQREHAHQLLLNCIRTGTGRPDRSGSRADLLSVSRQVQDLLLHTRLKHARVPNWFFNRFLDTDRADFAAAMHDLQRILSADSEPLQ